MKEAVITQPTIHAYKHPWKSKDVCLSLTIALQSWEIFLCINMPVASKLTRVVAAIELIRASIVNCAVSSIVARK